MRKVKIPSYPQEGFSAAPFQWILFTNVFLSVAKDGNIKAVIVSSLFNLVSVDYAPFLH